MKHKNKFIIAAMSAILTFGGLSAAIGRPLHHRGDCNNGCVHYPNKLSCGNNDVSHSDSTTIN